MKRKEVQMNTFMEIEYDKQTKNYNSKRANRRS